PKRSESAVHSYASSQSIFRFGYFSNRHPLRPRRWFRADHSLSSGQALAIVLAKSNQETRRRDRQQPAPQRKQAALQLAAVRQDQGRTFPAGAGAGDRRGRKRGRRDREADGETDFRKYHRGAGKIRPASRPGAPGRFEFRRLQHESDNSETGERVGAEVFRARGRDPSQQRALRPGRSAL